MKLRYLRAKDILSFGGEEIRLDFDTFNVIAGPNDSGKTNLFRAINLIEKAFGYGDQHLGDALFQGDRNLSLHLEVGVRLGDGELELLATLIICSELMRIQRQSLDSKEIKENKLWKSILTNYGSSILSKSFRCLSFVLAKDKLRTSELKMLVQMSDGTGVLHMNRNGYLSEIGEEMGNYVPVSLAKEIVKDFSVRFGNLPEPDAESLITDVKRLTNESPTLLGMFGGKLGGSPSKMVDLSGATFSDYLNTIREEPLLTKLSRLCELEGIGQERLYPWEILGQMYKTSFSMLHELRLFYSTLQYGGSGHDNNRATILGSNLAMRLFWMKSSGARKDREIYNRVQEEFRNLTGTEFDVAVRTREVTEVEEGRLGTLVPRSESTYATGSEFRPLIIGKEIEKRLVNEAFVQIIKDDYPLTLEQTASGIYEILFLLTTIVGESGKILLLDEPELHLHPTMQKRILDLLSESTTRGRNKSS